MSRASLYDQKVRQHYTNLGYQVHRLQIYNRFAGKAKDAFGWADWLAYDAENTLMIQSTSHAARKAHIDKYLSDPKILESIRDWDSAVNRMAVLVTFKKIKIKRGGVGFKFELVEESLAQILESYL